MRVLLAFDKFKDALTARQACETAARALGAKHPDWQFDLCPLTDGGEGFCETLTRVGRGQLVELEASGPLGHKLRTAYGTVPIKSLPTAARARLALNQSGSLAIIEMASASGLALLRPNERNPWNTSSFGTGEQIGAVIQAGANAVLLGVGGSATNDLGLGALAALGFKFLDAAGVPVPVPMPAAWEKIRRIDGSGAGRLAPTFIACDVTNPLLGPNGSAAVFGPQKGLPVDDLPRLETQAARIAKMLAAACGKDTSLADTPGAGAAGGIGFGLMAAFGATLVPGFDLVSDWLDLPARLAASDLVLTGEGRFDSTSLGGKGPGRLIAEARRLGKPAHVFAGSLGLPAQSGAKGPEGCHLYAITPANMTLAQALPRTAELLGTTLENLW